MNTDDGFVIDYHDVLTPQRVAEAHALLVNAEPAVFDRFIERARHPVSAYRSHTRAHMTIPDAKDQGRYLTKLENKLQQLNNLAANVSEMLDDAPYELRNFAPFIDPMTLHIAVRRRLLPVTVFVVSPVIASLVWSLTAKTSRSRFDQICYRKKQAPRVAVHSSLPRLNCTFMDDLKNSRVVLTV